MADTAVRRRDAYRTLENVASKEEIHQIDEIVKQPVVRVGKEEVSSGVLSEAIRDMLYTPESAGRLRAVVASASRGDYSGFSTILGEMRQEWQSALAIGVFLSTTCSEDIPFLKGQAARKIGSRTLAAFRRRQQTRACKEWPHAKIDAEFHKPFHTDVPTLIFSGTVDPATPPTWGEKTLQLLSNGRHYVLAKGHPMGKKAACIEKTMEPLLTTGSLKTVVNRCAPH